MTKRLRSKAKFSHLIACAFLALPCLSFAKNTYSLADLEVLKSGKSYEEFFDHAHDIIPTGRNEYWREMLSSMAIDFVDEKRNFNQFDTATYKKISELSEWSELRRDEFFQIKRNSYSLSYFKTCFTKSDKFQCRKEMENFWKSASKDLETSYQMALLHFGFFPGPTGITYLENILHQEEDQFYCARPIVQNIFVQSITEENLHLMSMAQRKLFLDGAISKSCWNKITDALKKALETNRPFEGKSLFWALNLNHELDKLESHEWLMRYYLQSPPPGELLNLSWNALKELSDDYALREALLKKITQRDPLPGELFEQLESNRSQALAYHLQETFPEYIATYAKTCLQYLEGRGNFPYGNPTPQCHQFFRLTAKGPKKLRDLLQSPWRERYQGLIPGSQKTVSLR